MNNYYGTTSQGLSIYVGIDVFSKTEIDVEVPNPYVAGHTAEEQKYDCSNPGSTTQGLHSLIFFVASIPSSGVFSAHGSYAGIDVFTVSGRIVGNKLTGTYSDDQHEVVGECSTGTIKFTATAHGVAGGSGSSSGSGSPSTGSGSGGVRCIVPKLAGSTLAIATKMLVQAHCKLGTVTGPKPPSGRALVVSSSSPTAGTRLASSTKVNLKLRAV